MARGSPLTQALVRKRRYVSPVLAGTSVMRQDHGQDYQGRPGQPVLAIGPGRVDAVKQDPSGFGTAIYYTLDNGQQLYVGHAQPTVRPGQRLQAGQPVAQLLAHGGGDASNLAGWTEVGLASGGAPAYPKEGGVGGAKFGDFLGSLGVPLAGGKSIDPGFNAGTLPAAADPGFNYTPPTTNDPGFSKWPASATLAFRLAQQRGLSPFQATDFAGAQYGESGFNPSAVNKTSGAAGLYQLLSPGYVNRANQLGGVLNPRANIQAILPEYAAYYRQHPNAQPGEAAAAVEKSGKGAAYYAQGNAKLGAPAPAASSSAARPQASPRQLPQAVKAALAVLVS